MSIIKISPKFSDSQWDILISNAYQLDPHYKNRDLSHHYYGKITCNTGDGYLEGICQGANQAQEMDNHQSASFRGYPNLSNFYLFSWTSMDVDVVLEPETDHKLRNQRVTSKQVDEYFRNKVSRKRKASPLRSYLHPPSTPPLTEEMMEVNQNALRMNDKDVMITSRRTLRQKDLADFREKEWLNDAVINFYLTMIQNRSQEKEGLPKVYCFYSAFYTLLNSGGGLKKVENATNGINIFEFDLLLFPVCISAHWRLVVVSPKHQSISAYNSLWKYPDLQICKNVKRYLNLEHSRIHGTTVEWTGHRVTVPQQDNNFDCGVFTLIFADYLSLGAIFDFGPEHLPYFRQKQLYECITEQLLS